MAPIGSQKKKHHGWLIFLIIFLSVLILPVVTVYGCFYDGTLKDLSNVPSMNLETMFPNMVVDMFDDTQSSEPSMTFSIKEDNFNGVLKNIFETITPYSSASSSWNLANSTPLSDKFTSNICSYRFPNFDCKFFIFAFTDLELSLVIKNPN